MIHLEENYLLEMLDIEKQFPGVKALDHAKLQLRPGSIHALMGENGAGKSTLMKCLFGIYKKDAGSIRMNGKEINFTSPRNALDHGVAMVHQELNQVLYRSVMENMWLGRFPLKAGLVDHKKMYNDTKAVLDDLEIKVDPKTIIGTMAVSQRQMLEIAKAVSYNAKILVLDEPTSSLTSEEVEHLFRIMRRLCDQGVGIIYISHKMDEIKRISDEVTIMRDGQWISTDKTENLSTDDIIKRMVNREMTNRFPAKDNVPGDVLMEVSHLTGKYMPTCQDVSFELRAGEVLGVAGLVGSRRTELLSTIFGIMARESGEIKLNGKPISNKTPRQSIKNGFAMLTEERRATGIFPYASILFNTVISNLGSYKKGPLLSDKKNDRRYGLVHFLHAHQNAVAEDAHQKPLRRQPAEGHSWPLAADEARCSAPRRADARHRRRRQVRDLRIDPAACQAGQGCYDGLFRNAGADRDLRPHPCHEQRPYGRYPRTRQGLRRY